MIRKGTERLLHAAVLSAVGLGTAILSGAPEAAVLVIPWLVLLVLGLTRAQRGVVHTEVDVSEDRLMAGDEFEVRTSVSGIDGTVLVATRPSAGFWPETVTRETMESAQLHDAFHDSQVEIAIPLTAEQWGVHDLGHVEVTVTGPYGLFRWQGPAGQSRFVRVHPTQTQVRNMIPPRLVRRVTGAHQSPAVGRGVEYADVRPFASGDSLREINWKATARSDELWVSQRHPDRATDVVLMLDSFVESGHDVRTVFGMAIEGAVALAESHLAVADRVGFVELGGTVRWLRPGAGQHQLERLTEALLATGLHQHVAERNLAVLLSRALPPRSFVVALTPLLDSRFIDALYILAAHGHDVGVVECSSRNNTLGASTEADQLARRVWDAERQMLRDELAEHGLSVAQWERGDHLDLSLLKLTNRRQRILRGRRW